jgi:UDP-N-acetylglucosamine 2-epimerase
MKMAIIVKNIVKKINLKAIVKLNDIGETEKVFMNYNNNIPLILLQHGYTDYNDYSARFDSTNGYSRIRDRIAVWGETQKKYLIEKRNVLAEKIFVSGSPKHDRFFHVERKAETQKKTILLAPRAITEMTAEDNIDLHIRYEKLLDRILSFVVKNPQIELIVKLHPIQLGHNNELVEYFKKQDYEINLKINSPVINEIEKSDVVISITSEEWDLSSIVLESQIMNKPILNISPTDERGQFQCVNEDSIISMTDNDNIEEAMEKILFDDKTRDELKNNTKEYLKKYLANPGDASSKFADYLIKFI